jgi:uncharacterized protein
MTDQKTTIWNIGLFILFTFSLSTVFYVLIANQGSTQTAGGLFSLLLMWSPAAAVLIVCIFRKVRRTELGGRPGPLRYLAMGYFIPLTYALIAYGVLWLTGIAPFRNQITPQLISYVVVGSLVGTLSSLGEEIGWRGFLVPQLSKVTGFVPTALISGAIWAVWHFPLLLTTDYNRATPGLYSLGMFTILVMGMSFALTWLRLRSNSLWPAVLLHTSHNVFVLHVFAQLTADTPLSPYFTGETGAALAVASLCMVVVFWALRPRVPTQKPAPMPATSS